MHGDWTIQLWKENYMLANDFLGTWEDVMEELESRGNDPMEVYDGRVIQCLLQRTGKKTLRKSARRTYLMLVSLQ